MKQLLTRTQGKTNPLNSLFFKCSAIVAICVLAVIAAIEVMEHQTKTALTHDALTARAIEVSDLLAMQLGGSVKFGNTAAMQDILDGVIERARPDAMGGMVVGAEGNVLHRTGPIAEAAALDLARQALEQQEIVTSADRLSSAAPTYFGDQGAPVGAVVTVWSAQTQQAILADAQNKTLAAGFAVMLVSLVFAGLFLRNYMSKPLTRIEAAMGAVADADYDVDVPYIRRGDEVGRMARRLDTFRIALAKAKESAVESAFKSAAFSGSSAPMMMTDSQLCVTFVNPACTALIGQLMPALAQVWPGLTDKGALGARLDRLADLSGALGGGAQHLPLAQTLKIGDRFVHVAINAAHDSEGAMIGTVVELADRTEDQRNAAVLQTIDANQLRAEFDSMGRAQEANPNFETLTGRKPGQIAGQGFDAIFRRDAGNDLAGMALARKVLAGQSHFGRFELAHHDGASMRVVEGGFSAILAPDGTVERVLFLGSDISDSDQQMRAATLERERIAQEQKTVVNALGVALTQLAKGDLNSDITAAFPSEYEKLRVDFNAAVAALHEAVGAVMHNADSIRNETAEITSAADDLSRRTEKQAATLEETAAALDQLTSSVRSAAEGANEASSMSAEAQSNAEKGGEIARQAVTAMDGIKASSHEISKITSVIDDIAFQTNLLALNAGVEAARAGEAGRGFAVVATEVRALAQRSSDAAREINTLISSSGDQVQQGVDLVDKTGAALSSIVTSVAEISKRVSDIAISAREQSSGLNEINTAMNELDTVTQQNAAMFEETTAASHALTTESDALAAAVARFQIKGFKARPGRLAVSGTAKAPPAALQKAAPPPVQDNLALKAPPLDTGWEEF